MKKKIFAVAAFALLATISGAMAAMSLNVEKASAAGAIEAPQPTYEQGFLMHGGASIKESNPSGIRFTTYVNPDYYAYLETQKTNGMIESFHFGTIYVPATEYAGTLADFTHAIDKESDVIVKDTNWEEKTVNGVAYKTYNTVQLFSEKARDNGYYGVKMLAKSYVCIDGEYTYVEGVERSAAQVAASAYADGETNDYVTAILRTAVTGEGAILRIDGYGIQNARVLVADGVETNATFTPNVVHKGSYMTAVSDYTVQYTSSNDGVFTVDEKGTMTAKTAGVETLTAQIGEIATTRTVQVGTASTAATASGEKITYSFAAIPNVEACYMAFSSDYINQKMAEGYTQVKFTVVGPWGWKKVYLMKNTETAQDIPAANGDVSTSTYDLAKDDSFIIQFTQNVSDVTEADMKVTAEFFAPVTAYQSTNGAYPNFQERRPVTEGATTYNFDGETRSYTVAVAGYTHLAFNASFVNEMMAKGYVSVKFSVVTTGSKHVQVDGTTTLAGKHNYAANAGAISFDEIKLTENGSYYVRIYFGGEGDMTVTAQFVNQVTAFTTTNGIFANYVDSLPVTASAPVYEGNTATIDYRFNVVNHVYSFINFDASLINKMMAEGYTSVTFSISLPSARYIHTIFAGTGVTSVTKEFGGVADVAFDLITLTENATYNIRVYFGVITDVKVTAVFSK